jgi:hypothetical protein
MEVGLVGLTGLMGLMGLVGLTGLTGELNPAAAGMGDGLAATTGVRASNRESCLSHGPPPHA